MRMRSDLFFRGSRPPARFLVLISVALIAAGCASAPQPVLRHELGEALGQGRGRLVGSLELARAFPVVPANFAGTGLQQEGSIFRGGVAGLMGAYGIHPKVDLSLRTVFSSNGAGWRFGAKYTVLQAGNLGVGVLAGYGRSSGTGENTYFTDVGEEQVEQTLSTRMVDFGAPVSWRLAKDSVLYGGVNYYSVSYSGSAATTVVSDSAGDIGFNLGFRQGFGRFDVALEMAMVKVSGTFSENMGFVPYFGLSGGIGF